MTYVGAESTAPVDARNSEFAELRALRKRTEAPLGPQEDPREAATRLVGLLSHPDRHIRHASRALLERLPHGFWQDRVLASADPDCVIGGVVALAHTVESADQPALLAALDRVDFGKLSVRQQLDYLRALSLSFIRLGARRARRRGPRGNAARFVLSRHDRVGARCFQARCVEPRAVRHARVSQVSHGAGQNDRPAQRDPCPRSRRRGNRSGDVGGPQPERRRRSHGGGEEPARHAGNLLRLFAPQSARWLDADQRVFYFTWLRDEHKKQGGRSFQKFLDNIEQEAYENATDADRFAVDAAGLHKPYVAAELPLPLGPGQEYTLDSLLALSTAQPAGRNFAAGRRAFAAARCIVCHRFESDGGATGPDLTQAAGRFNLRDLCELIVDPSKVVSDQYRATVILTESGRQLIGRVIGENNDSITLLTDPEDSTKWVQIPKNEIESRILSPTSLMPKNLLNTLNQGEVLDLLAYVLSRGNPQDPLFAK